MVWIFESHSGKESFKISKSGVVFLTDYTHVFPPQTRKKKKKKFEPDYKIWYGPLFKLFRFPDPALERRNILIKIMRIGTT